MWFWRFLGWRAHGCWVPARRKELDSGGAQLVRNSHHLTLLAFLEDYGPRPPSLRRYRTRMRPTRVYRSSVSPSIDSQRCLSGLNEADLPSPSFPSSSSLKIARSLWQDRLPRRRERVLRRRLRFSISRGAYILGWAEIIAVHGGRFDAHRQSESSLQQPRLVLPFVLFRQLTSSPSHPQASLSELLSVSLAVPRPLHLTSHPNPRLVRSEPLLDLQDPRIDLHLRHQVGSGEEGSWEQGGRV